MKRVDAGADTFGFADCYIDSAKMRNTMEQAARDFKLERKLAAGDFYTSDFVPVPPIK